MAPKRSFSRRPYLPPEIISHILLRLPPKILMRVMLVCKAWNAIIRSQEFIHDKHNHAMQTNSPRTLVLVRYQNSSSYVSIDGDVLGDAVKIQQPLEQPQRYTILVNYCNGLVCIKNTEEVAVWNPSIQRFKKIPSSAEVENTYYGFGYDSSSHDYKVVRMVVSQVDPEVKIYSLKSNSWKKIQSLPGTKDFIMSNHSWNFKPIFFNGSLHWLMEHKLGKEIQRVVALDLATEEYNYFPVPPIDACIQDITKLTLEVLGRYLCVCVAPKFSPTYSFSYNFPKNDVWIMKEYGVTTSWTRLCTIEGLMPEFQCHRYYKPLLFSETGETVILFTSGKRNLFWYDLETQTRKELGNIRGEPLFQIGICVGNLYLLDDNPVQNQG